MYPSQWISCYGGLDIFFSWRWRQSLHHLNYSIWDVQKDICSLFVNLHVIKQLVAKWLSFFSYTPCYQAGEISFNMLRILWAGSKISPTTNSFKHFIYLTIWSVSSDKIIICEKYIINVLEGNHFDTFLILTTEETHKNKYFRMFGVSEHKLELDTPCLSCMLHAH